MANDRLKRVAELAKAMRISSIEMGYAAGRKGAHFGGGLSCIEIVACLYGAVMDVDPKNPTRPTRDIFIMSKAHGVLALYTALAHTGFFPVDDLKTFELNEGELPGHPVMNLKRGIELSGGSLGMGLSQGIGIALGYRRKNIDNHVFVLLGDGECDEGSVWEAAMSAAHFKLDHLIAIVDKNHIQLDGPVDNVMNQLDLKAKFDSFGFDAVDVDGHDIAALLDAFDGILSRKDGRPKALIADTVKGKGISFMENRPEWHHAALSQKQFDAAMLELGAEVV